MSATETIKAKSPKRMRLAWKISVSETFVFISVLGYPISNNPLFVSFLVIKQITKSYIPIGIFLWFILLILIFRDFYLMFKLNSTGFKNTGF